MSRVTAYASVLSISGLFPRVGRLSALVRVPLATIKRERKASGSAGGYLLGDQNILRPFNLCSPFGGFVCAFLSNLLTFFGEIDN
jgi:hypothetical protein